MKILALCDTEFIGRHMIGHLVEWGHQISVLSIHWENELPEGARHISGDRRALTDCGQELKDLAPDVVVQLPGADRNSIEQTIDLFGSEGTRIVYCGSFEAYRAFARHVLEEPGPPDLVPLIEDDPLRDKGELVAIERILADLSAPVTVLRLPAVYGPGASSPLVHDYLWRMDAGDRDITIAPEFARWRSATGYVEDVGFAIALAAKNSKAAGKTYNVADSFSFTQLDWIQAVARAAEWDGEVLIDSEGSESRRDYQQHLIVDSSKIRQELGYTESTPINEALQRTVRWERSTGLVGTRHGLVKE